MFGNKLASRWSDGWEQHQAALKNRSSYAELWLTPPKGDGVDAIDKYAQVHEILDAVKPWEKNLSCAILVQKNDIASDIVDYMRAANPEIPIAGELDVKIASDNPLASAITSALKLAAYPIRPGSC